MLICFYSLFPKAGVLNPMTLINFGGSNFPKNLETWRGISVSMSIVHALPPVTSRFLELSIHLLLSYWLTVFPLEILFLMDVFTSSSPWGSFLLALTNRFPWLSTYSLSIHFWHWVEILKLFWVYSQIKPLLSPEILLAKVLFPLGQLSFCVISGEEEASVLSLRKIVYCAGEVPTLGRCSGEAIWPHTSGIICPSHMSGLWLHAHQSWCLDQFSVHSLQIAWGVLPAENRLPLRAPWLSTLQDARSEAEWTFHIQMTKVGWVERPDSWA